MITDRDMYFMQLAFEAAKHYESLQDWLDDPVTENGEYVVRDLLEQYAGRVDA